MDNKSNLTLALIGMNQALNDMDKAIRKCMKTYLHQKQQIEAKHEPHNRQSYKMGENKRELINIR